MGVTSGNIIEGQGSGSGGGGGGTGDVVGPASSTDNALVRWDSTTGKLLQDGVITETDAGVLNGATQVNVDNLQLDGNTVSSTNANGNVIVDPNGTGDAEVASGGLLFTSQAYLKPGPSVDQTFFPVSGFELRNAANTAGCDLAVGGMLALGSPASNGTAPHQVWRGSSDDCWLSANFVFYWSGTNGAADGRTTNIQKAVDGVLAFGTAANVGDGYFRWGGESYLAADATNATTTMAATGLTVPVVSGQKYVFKAILYLNDSLAADGAKVDFDASTATATNFRAHGTLYDTALVLSQQTTALATDFSAATVTGDSMLEIHGSFEAGSTGTFALRFAQVAHTIGTLTLLRGSHLIVHNVP